MQSKKISLTGDRPTGKLHLGHYIGSLRMRTKLQHDYNQFIMVADLQGISTNFDRTELIKDSLYGIVEDYLAVGIDPDLNTIFIQSLITPLHEIAWYYMNIVTIERLQRNPTVKQELKDKGYIKTIPAGFFCHPINQAADITAFKADVVPAGEDQKPMIEQTNEIVRKFNDLYKTNCLKEVEILFSEMPRLMGIDGKAKASKTMNNAIYLSDDSKTVRSKVFSMYTDPNHIHVQDKGQVEGNMVFHYLRAFYKDKNHLQELESHYQRGGLGDVEIKNLLYSVLEELLTPMRERRAQITQTQIAEILHTGNQKALEIGNQTLQEVREAIGIYKPI